jgi:hypothetical protein
VILKESENLVARPKGTGRAANLNWDGLATFLVSLSNEGRARFSCYTAVNLPAGVEGISAVLSAYAAENPTATPSTLLATTGAWAGTSGDLVLARPYLMSCGSRPRRRARRPSVCPRLARADPSSELSQRGGSHGFVRHCRAAIEDGHARSFCYERMAVLYEHRAEKKEVAKPCRRAIEILEAAGDRRSASDSEVPWLALPEVGRYIR